MESKEPDMNENPQVSSEEYPLPEVTVSRWKRFPIRITIEPIVFGVFLADSMSDAITQNFVLIRTCTNHFHYNQSICNQLLHPKRNISSLEEEIQPYSAVILTGMNFLSKIFPAFLSLFVGPWSDYNGRKLVLVIPALGYSAQYLSFMILNYLPKLSPEYVLLAVLPVTLTGGFTNFITGAYSYVSDISKEEDRFFRMSLIESVMFLSFYIGLLSSSYVLISGGRQGYLLIYGLCTFFVLITTIPTYLFVPESVQTTERSQGLLNIFDCELLYEMFHVCFKKREGYKRAVMLLVATTLTLVIGIGTGEANVLYLYTKLRFGWDIHEFTIWLSVLLACSFIGLLTVSTVFKKCLKASDSILAIISFVFKFAVALYMALIPSSAPNLMYYSGLFSLFSGICSPVARSILSKTVPKQDLGKVFALLGVAEAILPLATGPLYTILYSSTIHTTPSAFLFVSSGVFALCTIFFIVVYFLEKGHTGSGEPEHERLHDESVN